MRLGNISPTKHKILYKWQKNISLRNTSWYIGSCLNKLSYHQVSKQMPHTPKHYFCAIHGHTHNVKLCIHVTMWDIIIVRNEPLIWNKFTDLSGSSMIIYINVGKTQISHYSPIFYKWLELLHEIICSQWLVISHLEWKNVASLFRSFSIFSLLEANRLM